MDGLQKVRSSVLHAHPYHNPRPATGLRGKQPRAISPNNQLKGYNMHKFKILFVDDDEDILSYLKELFSETFNSKFQVEVVSTGSEAIGALMGPQKFDIVIADLRLQDAFIDGLCVLKVAREVGCEFCVLTTGYLAGLREGDMRSVDYILHKPFGTAELEYVVELYREGLKKKFKDEQTG
jgi:CheY-like chemotaxis protein